MLEKLKKADAILKVLLSMATNTIDFFVNNIMKLVLFCILLHFMIESSQTLLDYIIIIKCFIDLQKIYFKKNNH